MTDSSPMRDRSLPWRQMIPVDRLHPNPDNPRSDVGELGELEASIRASGLQQPLLVRPAPDKGEEHYYIEDGYRRWLAMKEWASAIPCFVRQPRAGENTHVRSLVVALTTSVHSRPLNAMDRARAYGRLRDEFRMSGTQIAASIGLSPSTITNYLILLELAPASQKRVATGSLTIADALYHLRRQRKAERQRKTGGSGQAGAVWEPPWLTIGHALALPAEARCDTMDHNLRRRIGRRGKYHGACGQCWEAVIRLSEREDAEATAEAANRMRLAQMQAQIEDLQHQVEELTAA